MASELSSLIDRELELVDREAAVSDTVTAERIKTGVASGVSRVSLAAICSVFVGTVVFISLLSDAHVKLSKETRRRKQLELELRSYATRPPPADGSGDATTAAPAPSNCTLSDAERAELEELRGEHQTIAGASPDMPNCTQLMQLYMEHGAGMGNNQTVRKRV